MIVVIVGQKIEDRKKALTTFLKKITVETNEVLLLDDEQVTLGFILAQLHPPLFGVLPKVIRVKYLFEKETIEKAKELLLQEIQDAETVVVFEETTLDADTKKIITKIGGLIDVIKNTDTKKQTDDIFSIANALVAGDKKKLWLTYMELLKTNNAEAMFGVLLWKVRQLSLKQKKFLDLYKALLDAQATSRSTKVPFEIALEKVLLQKTI